MKADLSVIQTALPSTQARFPLEENRQGKKFNFDVERLGGIWYEEIHKRYKDTKDNSKNLQKKVGI